MRIAWNGKGKTNWFGQCQDIPELIPETSCSIHLKNVCSPHKIVYTLGGKSVISWSKSVSNIEYLVQNSVNSL